MTGQALKHGIEWHQVRAVRRRHTWRLAIMPSIVAGALCLGWLVGLNPLLGVVESVTGVDVWERVESMPDPWDDVLMLFLGFFMPFVVAPALSLIVAVHGARRVTSHYRDTPACPFCGYNLSGMLTDEECCACPECGKRSVRFDAVFDWWSVLAPRASA